MTNIYLDWKNSSATIHISKDIQLSFLLPHWAKTKPEQAPSQQPFPGANVASSSTQPLVFEKGKQPYLYGYSAHPNLSGAPNPNAGLNQWSSSAPQAAAGPSGTREFLSSPQENEFHGWATRETQFHQVGGKQPPLILSNICLWVTKNPRKISYYKSLHP